VLKFHLFLGLPASMWRLSLRCCLLVCSASAIHDRVVIGADGRFQKARANRPSPPLSSRGQEPTPRGSSLIAMRRERDDYPKIEFHSDESCGGMTHTLHLPPNTDWTKLKCVRITVSTGEATPAPAPAANSSLVEKKEAPASSDDALLLKLDCSDGEATIVSYKIDEKDDEANYKCEDIESKVKLDSGEAAKLLDGTCAKASNNVWVKFVDFNDSTKLPECMAGGLALWIWWLIVGGAVVFVAGIAFFGFWRYHQSRQSSSGSSHSNQARQHQQPLTAQPQQPPYGAYQQQGAYPQQVAYQQQGAYPQQGVHPQYAQQQPLRPGGQ